jgi:polyferredoxin
MLIIAVLVISIVNIIIIIVINNTRITPLFYSLKCKIVVFTLLSIQLFALASDICTTLCPNGIVLQVTAPVVMDGPCHRIGDH